MYIYNFFKSLDLLKKNIPKKLNWNKDAFYFGYVKREEIENKENLKYANNYLAYSLIGKIDDINYEPIDEQIEYLRLLNSTEAFTFNELVLEETIVEAITLWDELACVTNNPFFSAEMDISQGFPALERFYGYDLDRQNGLSLFNGILERDIYIAEFNYFVKKYITCKDGNNDGAKKINESILNEKISNAVSKYKESEPISYNLINQELEDILQQIRQYDDRQSLLLD